MDRLNRKDGTGVMSEFDQLLPGGLIGILIIENFTHGDAGFLPAEQQGFGGAGFLVIESGTGRGGYVQIESKQV